MQIEQIISGVQSDGPWQLALGRWGFSETQSLYKASCDGVEGGAHSPKKLQFSNKICFECRMQKEGNGTLKTTEEHHHVFLIHVASWY